MKIKTRRWIFLGILFSICATTQALFSLGTTYYVDARGGNDGASGLSSSAPWKTISKINSVRFIPGDTILFKRGEIWREMLTVPSAGGDGSPITFGDYGTGAKPIINGSDILASWTFVSGTTYAKSPVLAEPKVVIYNGTRLAKGAGPVLSLGQSYYDSGAATLYVNVGEDPGTHSLEVAARDYAIRSIHKDFINFQNLDVRNTNNAGYYIQDSNHLEIRACVITQVAYRGMLVTNALDQYETSQYLSFKNLEVSHCGGTGISVDGDADATGHVLIQNCIVHDCGWNAAPVDAVRWTAGIKVWGGANYGLAGESDDVVIEGCEIYNQTDTHGDYSGGGIWVDQWGSGAVLRRNRIHDNATYGILLENMNDGALVDNNLVYSNKWGIAVYRDIANQRIYNNTLLNNTSIGLWCKGGESPGIDYMINNEFRNNIVIGGIRKLSAIRGGDNSGHGSGNVYDHNCLGVEAANMIEWGSGIYKSAYASWESAYGHSTYSVGADPLVVSAPGLDLHLQPASPCLSKGIPVEISSDFEGNPVPSTPGEPPDIGAYEAGSPSGFSVLTVVTAPASGMTTSSTCYGGTVTSDGGTSVIDRGVCWGTAQNPSVTGEHTHDGAGLGAFSGELTGLKPGTAYFARAYATNSSGTAYGNEIAFATISETCSIPFIEHFSATLLPDGWTTQNEGNGIVEKWGVSETAFAGGHANEIKYSWQDANPGTSRLVTPALDTRGFSTLYLSFKHSLGAYGAGGAIIKVQTSSDRITWADEAWAVQTSSSNIGPETVKVTLTKNLNGPSTFIALAMMGNLHDFDFWYIDDLAITAIAPSPLKAPSMSSPGNGAVQQPTVIKLVWRPSSNGLPVEGYRIRIKAKNEEYRYFDCGGDLKSFQLTGLSTNTIYYWNVMARGNNIDTSDSPWSNSGKDRRFTTGSRITLVPPTLVGAATGSLVDPISVSLSWLDTNSLYQEARYEVRIRPIAGKYKLYSVSADAVEFLANNLAKNTAYYWNVRAKGDRIRTSDSPWANMGIDRTFQAGE